MRKINSTFKTEFLSEEGSRLLNRDYFAFVELDNLACYVLADGLDDDKDQNSAEIAVTTVLRCFTEAPSMGKGAIRRYLLEAHKSLGELKDGMQLKASITIVVTNYIQMRYGVVGNTRFGLWRNDRILIKSSDQSLSENLVKEERLEQDKAALHEERNNLYSYLGMKGSLNIDISSKFKLTDGDIWFLFTRGVWEYCDNGELLDSISDAKEAQEIINNVEELILSKQPEKLDNYTLVVTFVDKTYRKPQKKWTLKRILLILIPILIIVITLSTVLIVRHRKRVQQRNQMIEYMESAEKYIVYDNYVKASEDYIEALKLAKTLKKKDEIEEIDRLKKLIDQIILADQAMRDGDYKKADEAYYNAREMSLEDGNVGKTYIESQLMKNKSYEEVYELLDQGDALADLEDDEAARARYVEAKNLAGAIFFQEGKQEAVGKISALDEKKANEKKDAKAEEEAKKKEEEEKKKAAEEQQKSDAEEAEKKAEKDEEEAKATEEDRKAKEEERLSAIEIEKMGNSYYDQKDYTNALLYYYSAKEMYKDLGLTNRVASIDKKIALAESMNNNEQMKVDKAQNYIDTANSLIESAQYEEALLLYKLARDIYRDSGKIEKQGVAEEAITALNQLIVDKKIRDSTLKIAGRMI